TANIVGHGRSPRAEFQGFCGKLAARPGAINGASARCSRCGQPLDSWIDRIGRIRLKGTKETMLEAASRAGRPRRAEMRPRNGAARGIRRRTGLPKKPGTGASIGPVARLRTEP